MRKSGGRKGEKLAEASISLDQFSCPVCLDLLKDPVTIPCGHSFCMSCITDCWDLEDQKGVYNCPQCRQSFTTRPALAKNTMLAEVVEQLKKTNLQAAVSDESGDLKCDIYSRRKHKSVKSCLMRLQERQTKFQQRIQQREKVLEELKEAVESHTDSAQTAEEDSERIFTELICSIERIHSMMTQKIRKQEKAAVSRADGLIKQLEQEIDDLRRRDAELERLSHTNNHTHLLKSFQSLPEPPESTDISSVTVSSLLSFDDVGKSLSQLKEKLEDFCREEIDKASGRVSYIEIIPTNEPKTKEDFLQYSCRFTLDPNTVNKHLRLSERNRAAAFTTRVQQYLDHPDRFHCYPQVLCRESVCGRCYWEVEWSGSGFVCISVSYIYINRKGQGDECVFGYNDQSWGLICSTSRCSFNHNGSYTELPVPSSSSRVGVYVDHRAGTLSFYSVSDTMSLIHTIQTTFTQPLYPGFAVINGSSVKLCGQTL